MRRKHPERRVTDWEYPVRLRELQHDPQRAEHMPNLQEGPNKEESVTNSFTEFIKCLLTQKLTK